jgi:hypothetical protein
MKRWMRYGLPAEPRYQNSAHGGRIHYQLTPPDYLGTFRGGGAGVPYSAAEDFRRTDQMMLTASNLLPSCTSFIVEWSFGDTYQTGDVYLNQAPGRQRLTGQLIWHGLNRSTDLDFSGGAPNQSTAAGNPDLLVRPYLGNGPVTPAVQLNGYPRPAAGVNTKPLDAFFIDYRLAGGPMTGAKAPSPWMLRPEVIQDLVPDTGGTLAQQLAQPAADQTLYTTFGYFDPNFAPPALPVAPQAPLATPPLGNEFFAEFQPPNMAVPWPKLIRVTVNMVDPADPSEDREQTFQFVFEVPQPRNGAIN